MTLATRILLLFALLFALLQTSAQEDIKNNITKEAEKMADALVTGDFDLLMDYTHPNVVKSSGGKQQMVAYLEKEMAQMAANGFIFESVEIGEPTDINMKKGSYQALVPKTTTMSMNGEQIISKDYLFGFSDGEGVKWTFVEAEKMRTEAAKQLFPDFETDIEIPEKEVPYRPENDASVEILELEDENAGTYDTPFEMGKQLGSLLGILFVILFSIVLLVGIAFLIVYLRKKKKRAKSPPVAQKPNLKNTVKIACSNCDSKNHPDTKYCAFCGHALL